MHTVDNKNSLLAELLLYRNEIKAFGVKKLSLFGSFASGKPETNSDIDLLVDFEPGKKSFDNFMDLSFFLEDISGRKVELITTQSLSKFIGPHILNGAEDVGI